MAGGFGGIEVGQDRDGEGIRPVERAGETWKRRDGIRAGAVSGPWRSAPRPPDAAAASASAHPLPQVGERGREGDLRAPSLGGAEAVLVLTNPVRPLAAEPVPLVGPAAVARTGGAAQGRPKAAHYSVLGAVLLGSLIAGAIIALAFLLRFAEDRPTQAVTPRPGAVVADATEAVGRPVL